MKSERGHVHPFRNRYHVNSKLALPAIIFGVLFSLFNGLASADAQNALIQHQIVTEEDAPPTAGREFWFGIPSNYWRQNLGGKYLHVYITSAHNTTAYVGNGMDTVSVPITSYKIATFNAPEIWEMESSGYVEENGVHVWSKDADLTIYFMSHNQFTSDGTYVIPTIGWGLDYVVAGFEALSEGNNDLPSEFTIAASTNNTVVTITPSCDLRRDSTGPIAILDSLVGYPAGRPFQITMNRGQSVQFMSVPARGSEGFDVTGTVIHSNNPIGVIGGSMCTNIPINFGYCDHVEHMLPPVRTWGETYYTTNFTQPAGVTGHDYGLYLFVSSKANQVIWRESQQTGVQEQCLLANKYDIFWDEVENAQKFWSDAPFMLVEYMNSGSYPDGANGIGDPAEVVINSREQYTRTAVFQASSSETGQQPYDNYATIAVNIKDVDRTSYDSKNILEFSSTAQPIDDTFMIFTVPHITPGVHVVTGDSAGVGVYIYGYGYDESYAWAGSLGIGTFDSPDTVPPVAQISGACYDAFVHLSDIGSLATKLNKIQVDSDYNMSFTLDSNWVEGEELDTASYSMAVLNTDSVAYLQVTVYDVAGNATEITSTYQPQKVSIGPKLLDFGTVLSSSTDTLYDTIRNLGASPLTVTELKLAVDTEGFTLLNPNTNVLAPDSMRILAIAFHPKKSGEALDSIVFGSACSLESFIVQGYSASASVTFAPSLSGGLTLSAIPNPVTNASVTFQIANQTEANMTLTIYDILGHEIGRPVVNVFHEPGVWQVSYDVSKVPSGSYTCRVSANGSGGETVISKRFVVQR